MGYFGRSIDLVNRFPDFLPLAWMWFVMWWVGLELWLKSRGFRTLAYLLFPVAAGRRAFRLFLFHRLFGFDWRRWTWRQRFVLNVLLPGGLVTLLAVLSALGW